MKTKFFKKLSFVLVVAMVLSLFVPAAGVFAAAKPSLNSKNKYLHLSGNPGPNEYNFNIKNKKKGWSYEWESDNEAIAEVNVKNGVTVAKAVGKTKVTVYITDKNGEEVQTLSATVTVRDNIKEVSISNPVKTLAVGEAHDYNRSYVTEANSTKKTSSITRWTVSPDTATIDDKGVFVATAGGEYTVTALSFQSKAKYNDWKADAEKYADYVLDTDETKVVVSANIVGVTQIDKNIINVEFDSSMKDTDLSDKTVTISRLINGKLYNTGTEKVKEVTLDATEKIAKVETYGAFTGKSEYQFAFGDLKDNFTAADTDIKEVAGLIFEGFQVLTDGSKPVNLYEKVKAVNSAGVIILHGTDDALMPYLTFDFKGDVNYGWLANNLAFISKNGETAQFDVKYTNHIYDEDTKTYKIVEYTASAIGVGLDVIIENTTLQYAVREIRYDNQSGLEVRPDEWDGDAWKTSGFAVPAGDQTYGIYSKYKKNDADAYLVAGVNEFNYDSTDTDKMVIDGNRLYPITQGMVTVLVKDPVKNNVVIGAFDITINPSRTYVSAIANTNQAILGNANLGNDHSESRRIEITSTDSMSSPIGVSVDEIELLSYPNGGVGAGLITHDVGATPALNAWNYGKQYFDISAVGAVPGVYTYKVTLGALNAQKIVHLYVTVLDSTDSTVVPGGWKVELTDSNVDLKEQNEEKSVVANVYGYNARNARVAYLTTSEFEIEVKKSGTNTDIKFGVENVNEIPVASASGTALSFVDFASYQVTAKVDGANSVTGRADGTIIGRTTFKVEDTTPMELVRKKLSISVGLAGSTTVHEAVKEAFVVKHHYNDINADWRNPSGWEDVVIEYTLGGVIRTNDGKSTTVEPNDSIFVSKIFYTNNNGVYDVTYTYDVKQTVTIAR